MVVGPGVADEVGVRHSGRVPDFVGVREADGCGAANVREAAGGGVEVGEVWPTKVGAVEGIAVAVAGAGRI